MDKSPLLLHHQTFPVIPDIFGCLQNVHSVNVISPTEPAEHIDVRMFYENEGIWKHEAGMTSGSVRYGWSRFGLKNTADNYIFSADVTVQSGVAAGLSIYCESGLVSPQALTVMLDIRRQKVFCSTVPGFQICDHGSWNMEKHMR